MGRCKGFLVAIVVIILLGGVLALAPRCWMAYRNSRYNDLRFDRKVWLSNAGHKRDDPRGRMAQDVKDRILKAGVTRAQVADLLGQPDERKTEALFEYDLGNWGGCPLCPDVLDFQFDKAGRLVTAEITEH